MSEQAAGELRATLIGNGRAWLRFRWATAGPGCGFGGRQQGLARLRDDTPVHTPAHQVPQVRRAPEGPAAVPVGGGGAWPDNEPTRRATDQRPGPLVWRAPEGPEGTGGLRGAAPNAVRTPSLAGGRALRRPEHPWGHDETRPRPVSRPRPRHAHAAPLSKAARRRSAPFTTAPAIRRSCPRGPRPRRGQPRGGRRGRGTESRTRSPGPRCGRSGSTAGRHRARHTRRA